MNQTLNQINGNILLADDEQTFLASTAELLRNEGFCCDCAENAEQVIEKLSKKNYDLLITDIKMSGNSNLELVRKIADRQPATSVIIITGYPSQQTAVDAIGLSIAAYLLKPLDFPQFLEAVKSAVKTSLLYKTVHKTINNLLKWVDELANIELSLVKGKHNSFETALNSFLAVTIVKIDETFQDIRFIANLLGDVEPNTQICEVMQCPKLSELTKGIEQSIDSIKKSRELYKSKQLAEIREKLENLLENIQKS